MVFAHTPGMAAAGDVIKAFRTAQPSVVQGVQQPPAGFEAMLEEFNNALEHDSFAHQEITEQIAQQSMNLAQQPNVPESIRSAFASTSEEQLQKLVENKPGDARIHVFVASYYRATGQIQQAADEMAIARELSPNKQAIIVQQGFIELGRGQNEAARDFFQVAFELDESNPSAREYYTASLLYTGDITQATALMHDQSIKQRFAQSDFVLGAARAAGANEFLLELHKERLNLDSTSAQNWASLAFLYFEQGDNEQAIAILEGAAAIIPSFSETATCISTNISNGSTEPQAGC